MGNFFSCGRGSRENEERLGERSTLKKKHSKRREQADAAKADPVPVEQFIEEGIETLCDAAKTGDLGRIEQLIEEGINVNSKNNDGLAPLHYAARQGDKSVTSSLLANGANVEIKDKYGWSPLHYTARFGRANVSELLLKNGANVNVVDDHGWSPLHHTGSFGRTDVSRLLLKNKANANIQDKDGWSPFHYAARYGNKDVARLLIKNGANLNIQDKVGWSPLHWAARNGHEGVAQLLLENGANVDIQTLDSETPLAVALRKDKTKLAQLLIESGADVSKVNQEYQKRLLHSGLIPKALLEQYDGDAFDRLQKRIKRGSQHPTANEVYRGTARCMLFGQHGAGKTSLLKTMVFNQSHLVSEEDRTVGVEVCGMEFSEQCKVWWYDFAGHTNYHPTHQLFLSQFSLFFIVVDLSIYECNQSWFDAVVGYWINMIINRVPSAVIRLVATHAESDLCTPEQIEQRCSDIIKRINHYEETLTRNLQGRWNEVCRAIQHKDKGMKKVPGKYNGVSLEKMELLKGQIEFLLSNRPDLPTDVLWTSAKDMTGIDELKFLVQDMVTSNNGKFPSMHIPKAWLKIENELLVARGNCTHYTLEDFNKLSERNGVDPNDKGFEEMKMYFQIIGILIHFNDIQELKEYVFHDPHWLLQTLGNIFHHNLRSFEDMPRPVKEEFEKLPRYQRGVLQTNLQKRALVGEDLLRCLLIEFSPDETLLAAIEALLIKFDICYKLKAEDIMERDAKLYADFLFIPSLAPDDLPEKVEESKWPKEVRGNETEYHMVLQFESQWFPVGLFEMIAVRFNKYVTSRHDWKRGFIGVVSKKITIKVTDMVDENGNSMILFAMRAEKGCYLRFSEGMVLVLYMNDLVLYFPGAHSMLLVECSKCISRVISDPNNDDPPYRIHTDVFLSEDSCKIEFLECPVCNRYLNPQIFFPVELSGNGTCDSMIMTHEHRQALDKNRVQLINDMDAKQLLSYVISKGILSNRLKEEIESKPTKTERNEALLDRLPGAGDRAFFVFCEALQCVTNQTSLANLLTTDAVQDKDRCIVS